ncbi:uncharacterized protein F4807DRAFT_417433 [Annulohypoxylon truncatum]|uniref:uncharacterized protein n=1 Tax=Annulohypoxylon truncatum TaxID=327061 RepID=UPI0020084DF2|nr:uncharacterized protein F4807DRAFT_417433 [Annulohypoxylon truncatum]KAI1212061.1 hypothetical protein F4807DRAFT_417433 [Annulohypoxylon truncatum]
MSSMNTSQNDAGPRLRQRRLLKDIKELVEKPYPNIALHTFDTDLTAACLVLTPENWKPLHMTINFPGDYPVQPPIVFMNSAVYHPNVYQDYICASILWNSPPSGYPREAVSSTDYTPAYTLKGIAIQLLSFFSSGYVEQEHNGKPKNLDDYRGTDKALIDDFQCNYCHFGRDYRKPAPRIVVPKNKYNARVDSAPNEWPSLSNRYAPSSPRIQTDPQPVQQKNVTSCEINRLPNELLIMIMENLDFDQLTKFAAAWPRISNVVRDFDIMRQRELQCFCLKQSYRSVKLGVGVSIYRGQISSEFDLLSQEAYETWNIRRAINNLVFEHWLPLPISRQHWRGVKGEVKDALNAIRLQIKDGPFGEAQVLFTFMNDVVVRLNEVVDPKSDDLDYKAKRRAPQKSNLHHASEKAIDSYFHLFHLLVCLATEDPSLVEHANSLLRNFMNGKRSKTDCPNLGHLLIALLVSDIEVTDALRKAIIIEAITRNVVWLLDRKGARMPELSYIEPGPVSAYRLSKTFEGSRTSYRLLMFSELFRRTARPSHTKPLTQVRDELFDRHGAPPRNAARELSETIRRLHTINDFPAFLKEMGLQTIPDAQTFTDVLRKTVLSSMHKGYSRWGMPPRYALLLRCKKDRYLWENRHIWLKGDDARWLGQNWEANALSRYGSFFPDKSNPRGRRNGEGH